MTPTDYDLPTHLSRIFQSDSYAAAAASVGQTPEAFQNVVAEQLTRLVSEQQAADLSAYENDLTTQALAAAVNKQ